MRSTSMTQFITSWPDGCAVILERLWDCHPPRGYVFLAALDRDTKVWREQAFNLAQGCTPDKFLRSHPRRDFDLYFCPNRFRIPRRQTRFALSTPFSWSDIDGGNVQASTPPPSFVMETSPGRFQALWLWDALEKPPQAERYSRILTQIANGDPNGWSVTKYLRVPGTYNHKAQYQLPKVNLIRACWRPIQSRPPRQTGKHVFLSIPMSKVPDTANAAIDDANVVQKYLRLIHPRARQLLRDTIVRELDRSKCVFEIVSALASAGASAREIRLALRSNPYFISKYGTSPSALHREVNRILSKRNPNA